MTWLLIVALLGSVSLNLYALKRKMTYMVNKKNEDGLSAVEEVLTEIIKQVNEPLSYSPQNSSTINLIEHKDETLKVKFHNGTEYSYASVPEEVFNEIKQAKSAGSAFSKIVRGKFESTKVV